MWWHPSFEEYCPAPVKWDDPKTCQHTRTIIHSCATTPRRHCMQCNSDLGLVPAEEMRA